MTALHPSKRGFVSLLSLSTLVLWLCGLNSCAGIAGETKSTEESAKTYVQIQLDEWRSDLRPGVSLILKGGGFVNNGFPAMSADGSQVAVLYHGANPLVESYPTFSIYSAANLALQRRIKFGPQPEPGRDPAPNTPEAWAEMELQLIEVNRILAQRGFQPIPELFDFLKQKFYAPIEQNGKRIERVARDGTEVLIITSLDTHEVELELTMPTIPVYSEAEDPHNNCIVQGGIYQGWYDPKSQLLVLRMLFGSGRDGCELPEEWILKRL